MEALLITTWIYLIGFAPFAAIWFFLYHLGFKSRQWHWLDLSFFLVPTLSYLLLMELDFPDRTKTVANVVADPAILGIMCSCIFLLRCSLVRSFPDHSKKVIVLANALILIAAFCCWTFIPALPE